VCKRWRKKAICPAWRKKSYLPLPARGGEKKAICPSLQEVEKKKEERHPARGGERERIQWEERKRREIYIASVGKKVNLRAGMAALGEE